MVNIKFKNSMLKNPILSIILFAIIIFSVICANGYFDDAETKTGKDVVKKYFLYQNEKNKEKVLTTLTEHFNTPNMIWGFDNLKCKKLINIREEQNKSMRETYLENGRGSINRTTDKNLKIFKVKFYVKYKNDDLQPIESGTHDMWVYVIRKDQNSPWFIDDMAY